MSKITIIDLLNKIAKGEEVPKEIKYQGSSYYFDGRDYVLYLNEEINYLSDDCLTRYVNPFMLNDEVEVIEEKEIEKLEVRDWDKCIHDVTHTEKGLAIDIYVAQKKINELIDVINDMRDKE